MQRRTPATFERAVLDVVVDEKSVVIELEEGRGRQDLVAVSSQRLAGRDAERRTQTLAGAHGVIPHQFIGCPVSAGSLADDRIDLVESEFAAKLEIRTSRVGRLLDDVRRQRLHRPPKARNVSFHRGIGLAIRLVTPPRAGARASRTACRRNLYPVGATDWRGAPRELRNSQARMLKRFN